LGVLWAGGGSVTVGGQRHQGQHITYHLFSVTSEEEAAARGTNVSKSICPAPAGTTTRPPRDGGAGCGSLKRNTGEENGGGGGGGGIAKAATTLGVCYPRTNAFYKEKDQSSFVLCFASAKSDSSTAFVDDDPKRCISFSRRLPFPHGGERSPPRFAAPVCDQTPRPAPTLAYNASRRKHLS